MFKLPNPPSPQAGGDELADFLEILAWINGDASATDVARFQASIDDNIDSTGNIYEGSRDQEDEHLDTMDSVAVLIEERQAICGQAYPFELDDNGYVLNRKNLLDNSKQGLYFFLLCATRLNMKDNQNLNGVDGTLLMEEISASAIRGYLGASQAKVFMMGTSSDKNFRDRMDDLAKELHEPGIFKPVSDKAAVQTKDGGVDLIGWIPFADQAPSKLVVFAQVKTGTSWRGDTYQCQPEAFQSQWFSKPVTVPPVRAFCVAESVRRDATDWSHLVIDTGLFLDRCRLVSCFEPDLFSKSSGLQNWLAEAKNQVAKVIQS